MGDYYAAKCIYGFTMHYDDRNLIRAIPKHKYYNELETWVKNSVPNTMSIIDWTVGIELGSDSGYCVEEIRKLTKEEKKAVCDLASKASLLSGKTYTPTWLVLLEHEYVRDTGW